MRNRFLWAGAGISLALHITFLTLAWRVEVDLRDVVHQVKLRMVEEAAERKKEKVEAKIKAEEKKDKGAAEAEKKKAEEAKLPPKVEPPKAEPKKEPPKEEPRKEEKPEVKPEKKPDEPPPPNVDKPKADKPKVRKDRKKPKVDKAPPPKEAEKKPAEAPANVPPGDGKKKGVPLDLNYAMDGTARGGGGSTGGSGVSVVAGDGMDLPDDGDDGAGAGDGPAAGAGGEDDFVDQDELYGDEEEGLRPEEEGGPGGGGPGDRYSKGVGGGGNIGRNEKKAKVKTVAAHKVSRSATVSKGVEVPYPDEVKGLEIQGRVHLELTVDETGKVADVKLKKGLHPVMDRLSMEAAWKLEFSPAVKDDVPVAVKIPYVFTFVLE